MKTDKPRIFVTGIGVILPGAYSVDSLWRNAMAGISGIAPYRSEVHDSSWLKYYGRVDRESFNGQGLVVPAKLKRLCSEPTLWGLTAADQALAQAKLDRCQVSPSRRGLFVAEQCTLHPGVQPFKKALALLHDGESYDANNFFPETVKNHALPLVFLKSLRNNLFSVASSLFQCKGDCGAFGQDEGAAIAALNNALFSLRHGYCDQALVVATGSYDEAVTLCELQADGHLSQSDAGAKACRPYDRARDGMILGEGAVAMLLESEPAADARNAEPWGEIVAASGRVASSRDARRNSIEAYAACLRRLLHDSRIPIDGIGAIYANGKGALKEDLHELRKLEAALGPLAPHIPVTCSTPLTGMLGVAGTLADTALSLLALKSGKVPPIAHLEDPELTALPLCRGHAVSHSGKHAVAFSTGLSGFHSAVLTGRV